MPQTEKDPLFGSFGNLQAIEALYLQYINQPASVDPVWQQYFTWFETTGGEGDLPSDLKRWLESKKSEHSLRAPALAAGVTHLPTIPQIGDLRIYNLIHAYREYGHRKAKVNPIATDGQKTVPELEIERFGFSSADLSSHFPTLGVLPKETATLSELLETLETIYCGTIGVEYMELLNPDLEAWLQSQIEPTQFSPQLTIDQKKQILNYLNESELFEVFLHTKYVGQKRFSLEGGETLIPMLKHLINVGADLEIDDFLIGMAHRGRLNVLSNVLNKSHKEIFTEFEDNNLPGSYEGSGDVKYHKGYSSKIATPTGKQVEVHLADNPSHLEAVNPVVEGQTRAIQVQKGDDKAMKRTLPILIHGDAAVAGQGVIYETLQMFKLPGYGTGGTIHLIINNQIGFTTLPKDARSTDYCTDIAKGFSAPVFHVNSEDPEGCVYAVSLAVAMRQRYGCDVFIELNCYRKYGHNEGDEPAFTQPLEYQLIRKKKPVREVYRDNLISQGVMEKKIAQQLEKKFQDSLQEELKEIQKGEKGKTSPKKLSPKKEKPDLFKPFKTGVSFKQLKACAEAFCKVPGGFSIHKKLQRLLENRLEMVKSAKEKKSVDWGMGEHLAFATLLWEGRHVRISGQDSRRGTFSHRHAMWVDQKNAKKYFPLSRMKEGQGRFDVFNSPLSEYSVLGYEFGYALSYPEALTVWEAQFGDFCNGAQIIIDQFICSSEQKWGDVAPVTLMLPHGFEGQGPEHSSARMERFLQSCGNENIQVVNTTTPAQLFHLLRRQCLRDIKKPLVIFTPKGLLRHPDCVSDVADFTKGSFKEILDDPTPPKSCKRLLLCSGKVYYELAEKRNEVKTKDAALVRVEQLYPLNAEYMKKELKKYLSKVKEIAWIQDEPKNMGAWEFIFPLLLEIAPKGCEVNFYGRPRSASPAAGSLSIHKKEQQALLDSVFKVKARRTRKQA